VARFFQIGGKSGKGIKHIAMALGVQKPAIIVLPVQFHQRFG
jgi:hypothetical protein